MKKSLLISVALVALVTSAASAQINARWTDCGGPQNITHPCATALDAPKNLILSWIAPATGAPAVVGYDIKVTYAVQGVTTKPCWWTYTGARAAGFAFIPTDNPASCPNFLGAFGAPIAAGGWGDLGTNRGRFNIFVANPAGSGADASPFVGLELYAVTLQIKAAGTGATCPGCNTPTQLRVNDIVLANEGGAPALDLNQPTDPGMGSNCGSWFAGVCDAATPAKSATWGSVKALYR